MLKFIGAIFMALFMAYGAMPMTGLCSIWLGYAETGKAILMAFFSVPTYLMGS